MQATAFRANKRIDRPQCTYDDIIVPTIGNIGSIQIRIYYDDHGVPHFHAVSPDFDFKIAIKDCSIISGNGHLRGRELAAIRAWGQMHRDKLYSNWQHARDGKPLQEIED